MTTVIQNYQASFDLFIKDLQEILEFVEPACVNEATFSHRIYGLLLRVCTDFESLSKDLLMDAGCTKAPGKMTVLDFRSLETSFHLEKVEVDFLLWRPQPLRISPFSDWTFAKPPLRWYKDYNIVKHNREAQFSKASLRVVIEAAGALFSLIANASDFDWGPFCSGGKGKGKYTFWRPPFEIFGTV